MPHSIPAPPAPAPRVADARVVTLVLIGATPADVAAALAHRDPPLHVLALVPDEDLAGRLRSALPEAGDRLAILAGPDYAGVAQLAARFADIATAPVVVDPALERAQPDAVAHARAALGRVVFQATANEGARKASAGAYLLQTLANGPRLSREADASALASVFAGVPAVVVAAGPSLDVNLNDIAYVKDRAVVIACDTAARPLLHAGIDPHIIVATDASRANAAHLSSLPPTRAWLVAEGSLHPSAFVHFAHRTFRFRVADHEPWPWLQSLGVDAVRLDTWGSVATSAFSLALLAGCDPIGLAGADFAFTDGRPYARGTSFESQWALWHAQGTPWDDIWRLMRERWTLTTVTDINGRSVQTAPHLLSFRDWVAEQSASSARRIVNATGAGILAGGAIAQQSLAKTLASRPVHESGAIDNVLATAHAGARGALAGILAGIDALAADNTGATLARWLDFAGHSVTPAQIVAALDSPEYAAWGSARR